MGMFYRDDPHIDESERQTGFYRYRQLLSNCFSKWWKVNFLTLLGFLPLTAGIIYAIGTSSILILAPCSILGGIIAGPFLSGMYDILFRGFRDDPMPWKDAYLRSWKQNWRGSLIPGALLGLMLGLYAFMGMLFWWAETPPSWGTIGLYLCSLLLVIVINSLYWPQLVLFNQRAGVRLRNGILFLIQNFWRVTGTGILQLAYLALLVLFAPWSLLLLPVTGLWYILFLAQFFMYDQLDNAFHIEDLYGGIEP